MGASQNWAHLRKAQQLIWSGSNLTGNELLMKSGTVGEISRYPTEMVSNVYKWQWCWHWVWRNALDFPPLLQVKRQDGRRKTRKVGGDGVRAVMMCACGRGRQRTTGPKEFKRHGVCRLAGWTEGAGGVGRGGGFRRFAMAEHDRCSRTNRWWLTALPLPSSAALIRYAWTAHHMGWHNLFIQSPQRRLQELGNVGGGLWAPAMSVCRSVSRPVDVWEHEADRTPESFHNMTVTGTGSEEATASNTHHLISLWKGVRETVTKLTLRQLVTKHGEIWKAPNSNKSVHDVATTLELWRQDWQYHPNIMDTQNVTFLRINIFCLDIPLQAEFGIAQWKQTFSVCRQCC